MLPRTRLPDMLVKKTPKIGEGKAGPGRPKGLPNKTTALLKDAILQAAEAAGGKEGIVGYLTQQAKDEPSAFMTLIGKVLPMQVAGDPDNPLQHIHTIKRVIIDNANS